MSPLRENPEIDSEKGISVNSMIGGIRWVSLVPNSPGWLIFKITSSVSSFRNGAPN